MQPGKWLNLARRLLLPIAILLSCGCASSSPIRPGAAAPEFSLPSVRGSSFQLADGPGQVLLLSFINTQADASSATADPSRAQIVFLKSMQEQYGPKGLAVWIVDAARIATGRHPGQEQLINFTYDWQLDDVPVLDDPGSSVARSYGAKSTPVTFLIGADGIVLQRWDGFASASQLALAIEALMGPPAQRQAHLTESPPMTVAAPCPDETPPQAKFAGVGLARPLSEELWVVDGGGLWGTGAAFPVQWLLLDAQNLTNQAPLHIEVMGKYTDANQVFPLLSQSMELLPADISGALLSGNAPLPDIYSLVTNVFLERPGCLEIRAVITREGNAAPLYQGSSVVSAR